MAPSDDVTEAEFSVLNILWDRGDQGATVRELVLSLYGRHEHSLHGGVKSFLDRLTDKGLVHVDKQGFAHRFFPSLTREEFVGRQLSRLAESHFGGSMAPMLLALVDKVHLSARDRATIQRIIQSLRD